MGKMLFMLKDPRPAVARVVLVSLLLGIPGRPAYAAAAAVARGAHLSGPGLAVPGKYSLAPLGVLTPTSVSISPMILPPLAPTLTPAAARPTPVAAAVPVVPASAPGARALPAPVSPEKALDSLRTSAAQTAADRATPEVFDGRTARSAVAGDEQVAVAITGGGASTARLAPASAGAARALPTAFVPATVIVAALEKAARTDPERGYLRAVEILEARTAMSREPKLAALKVLSALPLDRTLPYFLQVLKNASAGESTKVRNGDKNLYYIQRAMLHRMAADPRALSASPEALAVLRASYQDGNSSVRLAAAEALISAGVEPGPERADAPAPAAGPAPEAAAPSSQDKPGLLTRLGKMSPLKKGLLGLTAAATLGLAFLGHFAAAPSEAAPPPSAVVSAPRAPAAPAVPAQVGPSAQPAGKAQVKAPVATPAPAKKLTWEQQQLERQTRAAEDTSYRIKELGEKVAAAQPKEGTGQMSGFLQIALFIGGFFLISSFIRAWAARRSGGGGAGATDDINKKGKSIHTRTEPGQNRTRFTDVEGTDETLIESTELVEFLRDPAKYARMGAHIPKGVLMDGPPGTGKTLTAKALAGEAGVPFFSLSGADFQEMLVGVGAARVRDLIAEAGKEKAAIIFIDEIDAIGQARGGANANPEQESTLNAILTAMQGFNDHPGIVFIGATNRADLLDKALTRPGRFDRKVHVGLPHLGGREAILAIHSSDKRLSPQLDLNYVARRTTGLAGADLANLMNEAAILSVRRGADSIEMMDIDRAVDKATFGDESRLPVPEDIKIRVAHHESGHVLASLLNEDPSLREKVDKFTMVPHTNGALGLAAFSSGDRYMYTRAQLEAKIDIALGGLVAEELVFGSAEAIPGQWSTGPSNDLEKATQIAKMMVQTLGMGRKTGLAVTAPGERDYGRSPFGENVSALVFAEVNAILDESKKRVTERLTRNRHVLEALTAAVLSKETLIGDEIQETIDRAGPVMK